jgi:hypothetical protein
MDLALVARFGPSYHYFEATLSKDQLDKLVAKIRGSDHDSHVTCGDSVICHSTSR